MLNKYTRISDRIRSKLLKHYVNHSVSELPILYKPITNENEALKWINDISNVYCDKKLWIQPISLLQKKIPTINHVDDNIVIINLPSFYNYSTEDLYYKKQYIQPINQLNLSLNHKIIIDLSDTNGGNYEYLHLAVMILLQKINNPTIVTLLSQRTDGAGKIICAELSRYGPLIGTPTHRIECTEFNIENEYILHLPFNDKDENVIFPDIYSINPMYTAKDYIKKYTL